MRGKDGTVTLSVRSRTHVVWPNSVHCRFVGRGCWVAATNERWGEVNQVGGVRCAVNYTA